MATLPAARMYCQVQYINFLTANQFYSLHMLKPFLLYCKQHLKCPPLAVTRDDFQPREYKAQ